MDNLTPSPENTPPVFNPPASPTQQNAAIIIPPQNKVGAKSALIVVLILVVLGLVAGRYLMYTNVDKQFSTQKQAQESAPLTPIKNIDTASMKIYTHTSGLFTISYPSDWIASESNSGVSFYSPVENKTGSAMSTPPARTFSILATAVDPTPSLKIMGTRYGQDIKIEEISINGTKSTEVSYKEKNSGVMTTYYVFPIGSKTAKYLIATSLSTD